MNINYCYLKHWICWYDDKQFTIMIIDSQSPLLTNRDSRTARTVAVNKPGNSSIQNSFPGRRLYELQSRERITRPGNWLTSMDGMREYWTGRALCRKQTPPDIVWVNESISITRWITSPGQWGCVIELTAETITPLTEYAWNLMQ